jgi:hypothetical protein
VDKSSLLVCEREKTAPIQATQKRCKNALASGGESCNIGGARHQYSIFLEARFGGFFLF